MTDNKECGGEDAARSEGAAAGRQGRAEETGEKKRGLLFEGVDAPPERYT